MENKNKILVVEDNDFVRMQIVRYLNEESYETIEGTNGEEALKAINTEVVLAIVDVRMEPVGGFEFIKSIRGSDVDIPIILVTGDDNPDLLNEAARWGVSAVLMKPVQRDRLVKMVSRTIQGYRKSR